MREKAIAEGLVNPDYRVRMRTIHVLVERGHAEAAQVLLPLLHDREMPVRNAAIVALGTSLIAHMQYQFHQTVKKGHGRLEIRRYWTLSDPDYLAYLDPKQRWKGARRIGMVQAERRLGETSTQETRYSLLSFSCAKTFARAVRGHWGSENSVHWALDVAFCEDDSRVRLGHAGENLAVLRHIALNLLRQEQSTHLGSKAKRLQAAWSTDYLCKTLVL